jgi:hypothetical protein
LREYRWSDLHKIADGHPLDDRTDAPEPGEGRLIDHFFDEDPWSDLCEIPQMGTPSMNAQSMKAQQMAALMAQQQMATSAAAAQAAQAAQAQQYSQYGGSQQMANYAVSITVLLLLLTLLLVLLTVLLVSLKV